MHGNVSPESQFLIQESNYQSRREYDSNEVALTTDKKTFALNNQTSHQISDQKLGAGSRRSSE